MSRRQCLGCGETLFSPEAGSVHYRAAAARDTHPKPAVHTGQLVRICGDIVNVDEPLSAEERERVRKTRERLQPLGQQLTQTTKTLGDTSFSIALDA